MEDAESDLEASEVRRAFGIYGRGGTPSDESSLAEIFTEVADYVSSKRHRIGRTIINRREASESDGSVNHY